MKRDRHRIAARVVQRRPVILTSHEPAAPAPAERRRLPDVDVVALDNSGLDRPRHAPPPAAPQREPVRLEPRPPRLPDDRLEADVDDLSGLAAEIWTETAAVADDDVEITAAPPARKAVEKTPAGRGLYVFVAAQMHAIQHAKKAKTARGARKTLIRTVAQARRSVRKHWPDFAAALDGAIRHALLNPAPMPPPPQEPGS